MTDKLDNRTAAGMDRTWLGSLLPLQIMRMELLALDGGFGYFLFARLASAAAACPTLRKPFAGQRAYRSEVEFRTIPHRRA